jgi:hypothetical protein
VEKPNVVKRCDGLDHLHDEAHGSGRREALAGGGEAAAELGQVHAQQLHDEVVVLLKVAAVQILAHVRASLHALQH